MSALSPAVILVILLAGLALVATIGVVGIVFAGKSNDALLRRASATSDGIPLVFRKNLTAPPRPWLDRVVDAVAARVPVESQVTTFLTSQLVHAGFSSPKAPITYIVIRFGLAGVLALVSMLLAPFFSPLVALSMMLAAVVGGLFTPQVLLQARVTERQERLRRGIPDVLDLLVVCVEAGVSLDASLQRVAREMESLHPDLSSEISAMNRSIAAGMSREDALHSLYLNTGLDELRGLAANMVQSEQWGTPIAGVLRVYGDQLRKKRKAVAEKSAATAGTRMLLPLTLFIFPTIFIVLLGPAIMQIGSTLSQMTPPSAGVAGVP